MKRIHLNLKRFDIPVEFGGVNRISSLRSWGSHIVESTQRELGKYEKHDVEFVMYMPESHLIPALESVTDCSNLAIGCQGVFREDVSIGGNFGAFTTNRTAKAMKALGCTATIIGHCEERKDKMQIMAAGGIASAKVAVNRILNQEIRAAISAGLQVLYCIGENTDEQEKWEEVLGEQLSVGLEGIDTSAVTIAYEPIWSIGPGKTPAGKEYIQKIARFVKEKYPHLDIIYGGGLKKDNAKMLASIPEISGGLIALTRFTGEIGYYPDEYLEIVHEYLDVDSE